MASPFSGGVLAAGALLSSPALYDAFVVGALPISTALTRLVVAVVVCWLGLSTVEALVSATAGSAVPEEEAARSLPGMDGAVPVRGAVIASEDSADHA
jgi:hypothetical protein